MSFSERVDIQSKVNDALNDILGAGGEGDFVVKYVAIVEVLDAASGDRMLWELYSSGCTEWDANGLLKHALDRATGRSLVAALTEAASEMDDEDD